jgi:hypothetical protein
VIRINLLPIEELESPYWYVPDATVLAITFLAMWFGISSYSGSLRTARETSIAEKAKYEESYTKIQAELTEFKGLETKIGALRNKIKALQDITTSKLTRLKPLIVLEHLQNIKPEGIWFSTVKINHSPANIQVEGRSFDNLLVAEFLAAIESTRTQEAVESDLRSQVFFTGTSLIKSEVDKVTESGTAGGPLIFTLKANYDERIPPRAPDIPGALATKETPEKPAGQ